MTSQCDRWMIIIASLPRNYYRRRGESKALDLKLITACYYYSHRSKI